MDQTFVIAPYLEPLLAFARQYGMMVIGGVLTLMAVGTARFKPLALILLVIGLGLILSGAAYLFPQ